MYEVNIKNMSIKGKHSPLLTPVEDWEVQLVLIYQDLNNTSANLCPNTLLLNDRRLGGERAANKQMPNQFHVFLSSSELQVGWNVCQLLQGDRSPLVVDRLPVFCRSNAHTPITTQLHIRTLSLVHGRKWVHFPYTQTQRENTNSTEKTQMQTGLNPQPSCFEASVLMMFPHCSCMLFANTLIICLFIFNSLYINKHGWNLLNYIFSIRKCSYCHPLTSLIIQMSLSQLTRGTDIS